MTQNKLKKSLLIISIIVNLLSTKLFAQTDTLVFIDFINVVAQKNLSLLSEKYNIDISKADISAAKIINNPEIEFESTENNYTAMISYNLDLANKIGARVNLAKTKAEQTQLALDNFFIELRAEATNAFVESLMAKELYEIKKNSYEYMKEIYTSDSIRFSLGEISENEVKQSKIEVSSLLNDVYEQEAEYKSALIVLKQYMGKQNDSIFVPKGDWSHLKNIYKLESLIDKALEGRLDLLMAQKDVEIANKELKLTKAERTLTIGLKAGYEREWASPIMPNRHELKFGVTIPLHISSLNKADIRAAKYGIKQKELDLDATKMNIRTDVTQAYYKYEAQHNKIKQYKSELLLDAKRVIDGAVYKYKRGETSILEVLIAQRTHNELQESYINTIKEYLLSLIQLEKSACIWDIDF